MLESGRHVICEKPLAVASRETAALVALARSRPAQVAAVNYNVRYYPICREIRERVLRGDLGRVLAVTGSYVQDWLLDPRDFNWRVEPGGPANLRAVADIGTHWMDLAQYITGRPIRAVLADLATFHPQRFRPTGPNETFSAASNKPVSIVEPVAITTDDYGAVLLRFDGGARGLYHVSQVTAGRKNRLMIEIAGSEGSAAWDSESPNQLWLGSQKGPNQLLEPRPGFALSGGQVDHPLPGRTRRGLSRHIQAALPRCVRLDCRRSPSCLAAGIPKLCRR